MPDLHKWQKTSILLSNQTLWVIPFRKRSSFLRFFFLDVLLFYLCVAMYKKDVFSLNSRLCFAFILAKLFFNSAYTYTQQITGRYFSSIVSISWFSLLISEVRLCLKNDTDLLFVSFFYYMCMVCWNLRASTSHTDILCTRKADW